MVVAAATENNFAFWRELAARDPAGAARTLLGRIAQPGESERRAIFAHIPDEAALAAAFTQSTRNSGPLAGVPFVVKDLFAVAGHTTGAGSTFLKKIRAAETTDAPIVTALRAAGAVFAGLTQLQEFAYGLTGENPHFGDCMHPRFPDRVSGGSSSGSAAAVAAGIVPLAVGTDTAGSVRVPAAFCGLWGFRCRPHDRWAQQCFPLAETFDTAGWFTTNAADLDAVNAALFGPTAETTAPRRFAALAAQDLAPEMDARIAETLDAAAARIASPLPTELRARFLAAAAHANDSFVVLQNRDAARVHAAWLDVHRAAYDPTVWARLDRARRRTPEEFAHAEALRVPIAAAIEAILASYDGLVLPATPFGALRKADCTEENRTRLLRLTAPASLAGAPVATMPVPLPDGATSGLQIIVRDYRPAALGRILHDANA